MRILEDNSLIQQIAKTAVPYPIHKSLRQVAPQLIGIDLENQLGLCGNCGADAAENREHQQLDGFYSLHSAIPQRDSGSLRTYFTAIVNLSIVPVNRVSSGPIPMPSTTGV